MKVLANAAMTFGVVVLMGWLMLAQRDYQKSWSADLTTQSTSANDTNLATSMDRAMLALK